MEKLTRASMNYTVFGLLGGVYYRELTRHLGFDRNMSTQLRVVHTHCFTLGTFYFLIVLMLEKNFALSKQRNYKKFYITYNIGLGITLLMLIIHGTLTVLGKETKSRWITWSAGLGHIFITVGFGYFFQVLTRSVKEAVQQQKKGEPKDTKAAPQ